jgi:dynein intermediate chain 3, axonemal
MYHPEGGAIGTSQIRFLPNQDDSTFYGSSDDGELFFGDWFIKKSEEGSKSDVIKKTWSTYKSYRPTISLEISPFYEDVVL